MLAITSHLHILTFIMDDIRNYNYIGITMRSIDSF